MQNITTRRCGFTVIEVVIVLAIIALLGGAYYLNQQNKKTAAPTTTTTTTTTTPVVTTPTTSAPAVTPSPVAVITPAPVDLTADWKTYESKDLGLKFKYPISWGEPKVVSTNLNKQFPTNIYVKGSDIIISFNNEKIQVKGFTKDYKPFEALLLGSYYTGGANLDKAFSNTKLDQSMVYFSDKIKVANQDTYYRGIMNQLPEASGVSTELYTVLNGKTSYTGILISLSLNEVNSRLEKLYSTEGDNAKLNNSAITELNNVRSEKSDDATNAKVKEFKLWLSTFSF